MFSTGLPLKTTFPCTLPIPGVGFCFSTPVAPPASAAAGVGDAPARVLEDPLALLPPPEFESLSPSLQPITSSTSTQPYATKRLSNVIPETLPSRWVCCARRRRLLGGRRRGRTRTPIKERSADVLSKSGAPLERTARRPFCLLPR